MANPTNQPKTTFLSGTSINCGGRRSRPTQPLFLRWYRGENLDFSRCPFVEKEKTYDSVGISRL